MREEQQKPKHRISARAQRMWDRLQDWYGDALDQYGLYPPADWCASIDTLDRVSEAAAMASIRKNHPTFPPRFPEFDAICGLARAPALRVRSANIFERFIECAVHSRELTYEQRRTWTFRYQLNDGVEETTALEYQPDGDRPGGRITVEDLITWEAMRETTTTQQERAQC